MLLLVVVLGSIFSSSSFILVRFSHSGSSLVLVVGASSCLSKNMDMDSGVICLVISLLVVPCCK